MPPAAEARTTATPLGAGALVVHGPSATSAQDADPVRVSGELDVATVPVLGSHLDALLADGRRRLTLDLSEMTFCDVAGLHVLLGAAHVLDRRGGQLTVLRPCPTLRLMLDVLGPELISIEVEEAARA